MDIQQIKHVRPRLLVFLALVVSILVFLFYSYGQKTGQSSFLRQVLPVPLIQERSENLKPVRHVFFDLGANKGDSLSNFLGLEPTGGGGNLNDILPPGLVANNTWIIHAYEAHPYYDEQLAELKAKVPQQHTLYMNNGTAAWIFDGEIEFYLDKFAWKGDFLGSSLKKEHKAAIRANFSKITVPCHHIARVLSQYDDKDIIVMKVDVEGAEYDLFLDFMKHDVLKLVDYFAIEYHRHVKAFKEPEEVFDKIIETYGIKKMKWT